ncbi:MAG: ATP-binding protein, partial [Raoultibacter sp.]
YAEARMRREGSDGSSQSLIRACALEESEEEFLQDMARLHYMSGRGIVRTLSIARTIADLDRRPEVGKEHLCEALGLRLRDGVGAL